jgi:uncharacterized membrane protein HdeD (DUF308 family)
MATTPEALTKRASTWSILLSILLIIFGVLAITFPFFTSIGAGQVVGWLLLIGGLAQFVHAFQSTGIGHIVWKLLIAVFYFVAGAYLLTHPILGLAALTLALAAFFFAKSMVDVAAYFSTRNSGASGWILVDGIVTLLLGLMIWSRWPAGSLWVAGMLVGIGMVWTGVTRLMMALAFRNNYRDQADRSSEGRRAA